MAAMPPLACGAIAAASHLNCVRARVHYGVCRAPSIGFVGGFVLAFIHGWQLTIILLVSAPLLAGSAYLLMTVMADVESKSAKMCVW